MSKLGLFTPEEGKFFAGIMADEIPVKNIFIKQGIKLVLPAVINGLDDKVGDKVPEPWQSHIEDLVTVTYLALQDKVISDEESDKICEKCAEILNEEIDIPLMDEDQEAITFLFLIKTLASIIKGALKKNVLSHKK